MYAIVARLLCMANHLLAFLVPPSANAEYQIDFTGFKLRDMDHQVTIMHHVCVVHHSTLHYVVVCGRLCSFSLGEGGFFFLFSSARTSLAPLLL